MNGCSLAISAGTTLAFCWIYLWKRYLIIKPSIQVLFGAHVLLQWPLAVRWPEVAEFLPYPSELFFLMNGFVVLGLSVSVVTWRESAVCLFDRVLREPLMEDAASMPILFLLSVIILILSGIYFANVEVTRLGLIVGFTNPEASLIAREESFKLIENPLVRYSYSILVAALSPMAAVIVGVLGYKALRNQRIVTLGGCLLFFLGLVAIVSATGARYYSALLVLCVLTGWAIRRGFAIGPAGAIVGVLFVLVPPIALTALRQGQIGEVWPLLGYFFEVIVSRIFVAPTDVAMWYVHYSQTFGELGIGGIPRLAGLFGYPGLNAPNTIGLLYYPTEILSINANGGYLFSYYLYFGLISLPISLLLLWALDFFMLITIRLRGILLLASVSAMAVASLAFQQSDYTATLLTHGYAIIPLSAILLAWLGKRSDPGETSTVHRLQSDQSVS